MTRCKETAWPIATVLVLVFFAAQVSLAGEVCQPFPSNTFYPENYLPRVLPGDFNGDGIVDVAIVNQDGVTVFVGKGDGSFQIGATVPTGGADFNGGTVAGDFNHDGRLDVAVATSPVAVGHGRATVNIFLGNGDGTFQTPVKSRIQISTTYLAAGDFNRDGRLDLVALSDYAHNGDGPVQVLLGNGDGTFQKAVNYKVAALSWSIAVADLNGDGSPDFVVSNAGSEFDPEHTVTVFLNKGDGTFDTGKRYQTGLMPVGVAAADLSGNGKLDLITANYVSGTTSVLPGKGDGTFGAPVDYVTGHPYSPYYVAPIRFERGGKPGLAVETDAGTFILVNKGDGTFLKAQGYGPAGEGGIAAADLNGDGKADLIISTGSYDTGSGIAVMMGTGRGRFATSTAYVGVPNMVAVAVADFNGDGIPDVAAGDLDGPGYLGILLGDGKGGFSTNGNRLYQLKSITGIAAGDFNGDGKQDLAVAVFDTGEVQVMLGTGDARFAKGGTFKLAGGSPPTFGIMAVADFNGDGKLDIAVTSPGGLGPPAVVSILLGNGDGTFQAATGYAAENGDGALQGLAVGDFNGDGKADFAVADNITSQLRVFLGNGDGTFHEGSPASLSSYTYSLAAGDVNGDGRLDIAAGALRSTEVLMGRGDGTFQSGSTLGNGSSGLLIGDFNGDGKPDIAGFGGPSVQDNSLMELFTGNGDGTFGPGVTTYVSIGPYKLAAADLTGSGVLDLVTAGAFGGEVSVLLNHCGGQ